MNRRLKIIWFGLRERIDRGNKNYVKGLIIVLNEKLIKYCKYIENIYFEHFCSLVGINKVIVDKNLKEDYDYTKD